MRIKEISASSRVDLQFKNKIYEQAELSLKKINAKNDETNNRISLEESTKADILLKSARPNANFTFEVSNKVNRLKSLEESISRLSTESYSAERLEKKLGYDYNYLTSLGESSFQNEESKTLFTSLVEEALVLTGSLYKETNVTPRLMSLAINEDLTEAENNIIYENALTHSLEKNFRIPLLQGNLLQENEENVKRIIKVSVDKGLTDLGEIDPSEMATYLPFQDTVKDHVSNALVPDTAMDQMNNFNNAQDETYTSMEGNAPDILEKLDRVLDKISTMLSPALFKDKVDMGEDSFDGTKYAMMKAVTDMDEVPVEAVEDVADVEAAPETSDEILDPEGAETLGDAGEGTIEDINTGDAGENSEIEAEADAIDDAIDTGKVEDATAEVQAEIQDMDNAQDNADKAIEAVNDETEDVVLAKEELEDAKEEIVDSAVEQATKDVEDPKEEAGDRTENKEDDQNNEGDLVDNSGEAQEIAKEEDKAHEAEIDEEQLEIGVKEEMEHTEDEAVATKIATDHLKEDPDYYTNKEDAEKQDLDKDGNPDSKEPHGLDADSDGNPVDKSDKDKSHGKEKEEKEEKEEKGEKGKKGVNPFAKK